MRKLLWKEWHEQSWKLGFGCIVLSAVAVIGLHSRMIPDETLIEWICVVSAALLPILSSTGLVPAERAEGSLESLLAMPIAPSRILAAKTCVGIFLCVGPLAVTAIVTLLMAGGRELLSSSIAEQYARYALVSVSLFIWMLALTIRLPSETRAALIAVGVLILWLIASIGLNSPSLRANAFAISPFAWAVPPTQDDSPGDLPPFVLVIAVQVVVLNSVWFLSLRMFVRPVEGQA